MCVRQVSACTPPVVHTVVATTCVRNPEICRKKQHSSLHDHLDKKKNLQFVVWVRWVYVQNPLKKNQTSSFHVRGNSRLANCDSLTEFESKFHVYNILSVSRNMLETSEFLSPQVFSECYIWSFRELHPSPGDNLRLCSCCHSRSLGARLMEQLLSRGGGFAAYEEPRDPNACDIAEDFWRCVFLSSSTVLLEKVCVHDRVVADDLCWDRIWSGSQAPRSSCGVARVLRFLGRESTARCGEEHDVVDVQEQQKWVETWEKKARWRTKTLMRLTPFSWHLSHARICTRMKMCGCAQTSCATEKCACNKWVHVHSPSCTLWSLLHVHETQKNVGKKNIHHSMTILTKNYSIRRLGSEPFKKFSFHVCLDLACRYLSRQLAFHQSWVCFWCV